MGTNNSELVSVGVRQVRKEGNSLVVSLPKRDMREVLEISEENADGQNVMMKMDDSGQLTADLSPLLD